MAAKDKLTNEALRLKGKTEQHVGRALGNALEAKGVADEVRADLKSAKQNVEHARKTAKSAAKKATKKVAKKAVKTVAKKAVKKAAKKAAANRK